MTPSPDPFDVAVGVVYDQRGCVLIARRPPDKPLPGLWEFPGGKLEPGEAPEHALARELDEELGIHVTEHRPLITFVYRYEHSPVRLWVYEVLAYHGRPEARHHSAMQWVPPDELDGFDMPAANATIGRAVALPRLCLITDVGRFGYERTLEKLEQHVASGRVLVVVREKSLEPRRLRSLIEDVARLTRSTRSRLCVHADCRLDDYSSVDGVHWAAHVLQRGGPLAGRGLLTGVSCHSRVDLDAALARGADYAFLSPVKPTDSHPDTESLGWKNFEEICRESGLPVYALGGMRFEDQDTASRHGAQGVAMLSAAWE